MEEKGKGRKLLEKWPIKSVCKIFRKCDTWNGRLLLHLLLLSNQQSIVVVKRPCSDGIKECAQRGAVAGGQNQRDVLEEHF